MSFNITSDGSPTPRKGPSKFSMPTRDLRVDTSPEALGQAVGGISQHHYPPAFFRTFGQPLTSNVQGVRRPIGSSALSNQTILQTNTSIDESKASQNHTNSTKAMVNTLLGQHHRTHPTPPNPLGSNSLQADWRFQKPKGRDEQSVVVDPLLQRFHGRSSPPEQYNSSSDSVPITPATDRFSATPPSSMENSILVDASELKQLKDDLNAARLEVNRMNQELHSQQVARSTIEHLSQSSEADYGYSGDVTEQTLAQLQNNFNASARATTGWGNEPMRLSYNNNNTFDDSFASAPYQNQARQQVGQQGFRRNGYLNEPTHFPLDQSFRSTGMANGGLMNSGTSSSFTAGMTNNMSNPPSRPGSAFDPRYTQYAMPQVHTPGYPAPIGTMPSGLSPNACEFNAVNGLGPSPWNNQVPNHEVAAAQYVPPVEPMNYRRLLDKNMSCNWRYIVDKIICNNDQQASIFLQQKLKVSTHEQKYEIVEAIISQAYPLMVNRFGNFLVQRCFEHGTSDQIVAIAQTIRGNTLALSMDAFGCHVIQKAFDCVPEEYKATMVHELLRRIPETVIHRYACHVWQKLFELRWSDSPPQIMRYVNEALRGMWHEVALGETGSLVVQNIFENCLEEDKRPCINEVLASIDAIAHGQFGNWCIQHICEHGAPADRSRAIDHILRFATEYSMDQYASKVIEKCLKIGGNEFLDRYLERVCEGRQDRPRMPLIDIAGDQFGNYLIQYILTNTSAPHRDIVRSHIRKHMVSLRGSKYGSRVAMLCNNPAVATRPGPPAGMVPRYNTSMPRTVSSFSTFR